MEIIDLKDSPYKDSKSKNGFDSVSTNKISLKIYLNKKYPSCNIHGAMNKVDSSGLWRCLTCNVGCFQVQ